MGANRRIGRAAESVRSCCDPMSHSTGAICFLAMSAHRRFHGPQPCAKILSTSSSKAAAVTSAPAPGPWITSGCCR